MQSFRHGSGWKRGRKNIFDQVWITMGPFVVIGASVCLPSSFSGRFRSVSSCYTKYLITRGYYGLALVMIMMLLSMHVNDRINLSRLRTETGDHDIMKQVSVRSWKVRRHIQHGSDTEKDLYRPPHVPERQHVEPGTVFQCVDFVESCTLWSERRTLWSMLHFSTQVTERRNLWSMWQLVIENKTSRAENHEQTDNAKVNDNKKSSAKTIACTNKKTSPVSVNKCRQSPLLRWRW